MKTSLIFPVLALFASFALALPAGEIDGADSDPDVGVEAIIPGVCISCLCRWFLASLYGWVGIEGRANVYTLVIRHAAASPSSARPLIDREVPTMRRVLITIGYAA